jgi:hypothetical protein
LHPVVGAGAVLRDLLGTDVIRDEVCELYQKTSELWLKERPLQGLAQDF